MLDVIALGETMVQLSQNEAGMMRYAGDFKARVAGAESNTALGLARLGHKAGWVSRVGNDEFGEKILFELKGAGIDLSCVTKSAERRTGVFFKERVSETSTRIYYYRENSAATELSPEDIAEDYFKKARFLYMTGITALISESAASAVKKAAKLAKENGIPVVFDPNIRKTMMKSEETGRKQLMDLIALTDIVLPGIEEGRFLFGTSDEKTIAERISALGPQKVIVKLGADGAFYSGEKGKTYVPGFTVARVIDPVGAGDAFAAGFLSGKLDGLEDVKAVERAAALGAMATQVRGDTAGLPDRGLLEAFMKNDAEDVKR